MNERNIVSKVKSMHNPPHPGDVLREIILDNLKITIAEAASFLDVSRVTLSRLLNKNAGVSASMALRLSKALGTTPNVWLNLQSSYDLWRARNLDLSNVRCFKNINKQIQIKLSQKETK